MNLTLSTLAIGLGTLVSLVNGFGVVKPDSFGAVARKFPRSVGVGQGLMLLAAAWFIWNVSRESLADFESMKKPLYALFVAVTLGSCLFLKDFLAVRALAVLMLLLAKLMVDTARWSDTPWRLVIVGWAYVLVIGGIWFTISPWRFRDLVAWHTTNAKRTRILSGVRLAFGLLVLVLGFTAY